MFLYPLASARRFFERVPPASARNEAGLKPCTAPSTLFNSWFQSGAVSLNGVVNPANSLTLNTSSNCNFYLWSEQMFLWLTSPAPAGYGGSGRVFDSNVFYEVTTAVNNKRYFIPNIILPPNATSTAKPRTASLRAGKPGPHGLPAVVDRKGNIIEIVPPQLGSTRKPLVLNSASKKVEVAKVVVTPEKRALFYDAAGKVIKRPKPLISAKLSGARVGQRFVTAENTPVIVDLNGLVLDVDPAQAGGAGVLLAQNGSVIYYSLAANDVYAYFASGVNSGKITATAFPTTQANLNTIQTYAGQTFPDGIALAVEVKLSWIDATNLPNVSSYITTPALVPVWNTSNPYLWTPTGATRVTTLALLGVHFVGSAAGHGEMIWSTFEHFGNSPNGAYQYVNTNNQTVPVPASTAGTWLLSATNSSGPFNVAHADFNTAPNIEGANGFTIGASDTQRVYAFGVAPTGVPNQNDPTPAAANTEVISINNSVLGQLISGDVRQNYYFVGSTWTFGGFAPTYPFPVLPVGNSQNGAQIGTSYLTNSTMETYQQAVGTAPSTNCFSCHHNAGTQPPPAGTPVTTAVSHIFDQMQPLGSTSSAATKKKK